MNTECSKEKDCGDPFWADDIEVLFKSSRIVEFFPSNDMTENEKLNSVSRLAIYFSVLISVYKKNTKYMLVGISALIFTFFVNYFNPIENFTTSEKNKELCTYPTDSNPFMNVLPTDYSQNPNKPPACDINDPQVKKAMKKGFEKGLYKDANDPFDNKNSQRQFYTMPSTTIPNDRLNFTKWLYNKDDGEEGKNIVFTDIRNNKPLLNYADGDPTDLQNNFILSNTRTQSSKQKFD
jgi:hypothetical protein